MTKNNKIIIEEQDENQEKSSNKIITESKNKTPKKEKENKMANDDYTPPKLSMLEKAPKIKTISKSKIKNSIKIPKKEDFIWKDKLFVISGKLETTEIRDDMNSFLSFWGMIRRSSVSKKTDILIHGFILDDGREYNQSGKYKKALKFKTVEIISENTVDKIFREFTGFSLQENFNKYNENADNYPKNLYEEEVEENEDLVFESTQDHKMGKKGENNKKKRKSPERKLKPQVRSI